MHEHPAVTFHTARRLERIEAHLAVIAAHLTGRAPEEQLQPLGYEWLADLVAFAHAEPKADGE